MTSTDGLTHFDKVNIVRGIAEMPTRSFPVSSLVIFALFSTPILAETINGKVVGVSDGDTITVLDATFQQYKIKLSGMTRQRKNRHSASGPRST